MQRSSCAGCTKTATLDEFRVKGMLTANRQEKMPPITDAAKYHIYRACLQASIWRNAYAAKHGDMHNAILNKAFLIQQKTLTPVMSSKGPISKNVVALVACNCRNACDSRKCSCFKADMKCTLLCHKQSKTSNSCKNRNDNQL